MIIGNKELSEALNSKKIEIVKYTCSDNNLQTQVYTQADLDGRHKIKLHAGFLVKTLSSSRWINPKFLYEHRDGIVDLRKVPDSTYYIQSGETIILYTSEVVTLSPNYFGLILPKINDEEKGLFISTSYVDPNWAGVLQILVSNKSESPQPIKKSRVIANLILMKTSEEIKDEGHETQNSHRNVSWKNIFEDETNLPKWSNRERSIFTKILHGVRTRWILFTALFGSGGVIAIILKYAQFIIDLIKIIR